MTLRTITVGLAALAAVTCHERELTAPDAMACVPTASVAGSLTGNDARAAAAAAVDDSRLRIVPELRADTALGGLQAIRDLAAALNELAAALAQPHGSLDGAVQRASQAIATLEDEVKADAGRAADVSAVRLAAQQVCELGT